MSEQLVVEEQVGERPKVLILNDAEGLLASAPGVDRMREVADVRVVGGSLSEIPDEDLAEVAILMAVRERSPLSSVDLDRLPRLRLILQTGGHAYHLDGAHATLRGVPVALGRRARGPRAAVPELTFALAIGASRHLTAAAESMRAGKWEPFLGRTLSGRTLGILGYGRHGRAVAALARAFGMEVLVWARSDRSGEGDVEFAPLDEVLARCDILTVHLRLSDESRGLIGEKELARMKPGSILINTARGAIVDEEALVRALRTGPLAAAGLDVFASEPLATDSELRQLRNVIALPHIGWTVEEVFVEFAEIAADQLEAYLRGALPVEELLNPEVLSA